MSYMNVGLRTDMYSSYAKLLAATGNTKSMAEIFAEEFVKQKKAEQTDETQTDEAGKTASAGKTATGTNVSAPKKDYPSAVGDYKKRHPEWANHVTGQVRLGKQVLERNGVADVDRDSMTMDEYKLFFTALMDSIPYDSSQRRDVNVWTISEKGWEQMKNDPDYEAWVLGYTSEDRSVHNPWAAMPGVSPHYHTERFGASIDEHLGQSMPVSGPDGASGESWWEKRHKLMQKYAKEHAQKAQRQSAAKRKQQAERIMQERRMQNAQLHQFLNNRFTDGQPDMKMILTGQFTQAYESTFAFTAAGSMLGTGGEI